MDKGNFQEVNSYTLRELGFLDDEIADTLNFIMHARDRGLRQHVWRVLNYVSIVADVPSARSIRGDTCTERWQDVTAKVIDLPGGMAFLYYVPTHKFYIAPIEDLTTD
jgi:hypothetical protein